MRSLLWTLTLAMLVVAGSTGCSNKGIELNTEKTIAFDKNRDPEPKAVGGPAGKGAPIGGPAMTGKGKFGAPGTTPPK